MTDYPIVRLVAAPELGAATRFDFNDGRTWALADGWSLGTPQLLGAPDGVGVDYGLRRIEFAMAVRDGKLQAHATINALMRELCGRDRNWLMFQVAPDTPPVWFHTYRTMPTQLDMSEVYRDREVDQWRVGVALDADPFAVGEAVMLGPYSVSADPAVSGGCHVDVANVPGDVPTPLMVLERSGFWTRGVMAVRHRGVPESLLWMKQAEDPANVTLGADTIRITNSAPTPLMSGTLSTNHVRVSFGTTAGLVERWLWSVAGDASTAQRKELHGDFRVYVAAKSRRIFQTVGGGRPQYQFRASVARGDATTHGPAVTVLAPELPDVRFVVDLGVVSLTDAPQAILGRDVPITATPASVAISAARLAGTESLDIDCIMLIPADEGLLQWYHPDAPGALPSNTLVDPVSETVLAVTAANVLDEDMAEADFAPAVTTGGFVHVSPGVTNRVFMLFGGPGDEMVVSRTASVELAFRPRYLYLAGT